MDIIEKKQLDALMRFCTAESAAEAQSAKEALRRLLKDAASPPEDKEAVVRKVLLDLGVPGHLIGYPYLVEALMLVLEDEIYLRQVTKRLYPDVAIKFNTAASRVERAILHAIEAAWDRCDVDMIFHYFGNTISPGKGKPTNSEFIARVTSEVRQMTKE